MHITYVKGVYVKNVKGAIQGKGEWVGWLDIGNWRGCNCKSGGVSQEEQSSIAVAQRGLIPKKRSLLCFGHHFTYRIFANLYL